MISYICHKLRMLFVVILEMLAPMIPDKPYLKAKYRLVVGKRLNLKNPRTFSEKLQWLKLYNRKPEYTTMVDKVRVKEYIAEKLGEEYIIPTLGVWDNAEDIDFDSLPEKFVLKCNHNSGIGMYICHNKSKLNKREVIKGLRKGLKENYFLHGREWPYKDVSRKVLAEQFMVDPKQKELRDYKFFCFNGKVRFFKIDFGRFVEHHANYYSPEGKLLDHGETVCPPKLDYVLEIPSALPKMISLAEQLSVGQPFLRVDFYDVGGKIYFGELTFYPASGMSIWTKDGIDLELGEMVTLPNC